MGYDRSHAIIVTSWDEDALRYAHQIARDRFSKNQVSGVVEGCINSWQSFLIGPDGSKEGWEASDEGDRRRADYVRWLKDQAFTDGSSRFNWVEVQYGDDDLDTKIVHASDWEYAATDSAGHGSGDGTDPTKGRGSEPSPGPTQRHEGGPGRSVVSLPHPEGSCYADDEHGNSGFCYDCEAAIEARQAADDASVDVTKSDPEKTTRYMRGVVDKAQDSYEWAVPDVGAGPDVGKDEPCPECGAINNGSGVHRPRCSRAAPSASASVEDRLAGSLNLKPEEVTGLVTRLRTFLDDNGEYDQNDKLVVDYDDVSDIVDIAHILWEAHAYRRLADSNTYSREGGDV